jgi:hypothetical protein
MQPLPDENVLALTGSERIVLIADVVLKSETAASPLDKAKAA